MLPHLAGPRARHRATRGEPGVRVRVRVRVGVRGSSNSSSIAIPNPQPNPKPKPNPNTTQVDSGSFDARLLHGTGPQRIPSPDELTPDSLGALLAGLSDPAPHAPHVEMAHWR